MTVWPRYRPHSAQNVAPVVSTCSMVSGPYFFDMFFIFSDIRDGGVFSQFFGSGEGGVFPKQGNLAGFGVGVGPV